MHVMVIESIPYALFRLAIFCSLHFIADCGLLFNTKLYIFNAQTSNKFTTTWAKYCNCGKGLKFNKYFLSHDNKIMSWINKIEL